VLEVLLDADPTAIASTLDDTVLKATAEEPIKQHATVQAELPAEVH
jgi:hypothetical protein